MDGWQPHQLEAGRSTWPLVFVAENNAGMRGIICAELRAQGYQVVEASDALELLERIEAVADLDGRRVSRASVIISDVRMPGLNGLDFLGALRCADWSTPVILINGVGDEQTHARARELGAAAVIDSPFELDALRAAVRNAEKRVPLPIR
jgi:DNA-binding response OmpR family regulator